ncbi:hypothetical protein ABT56_00620 [Photobacterium aquae]|uniref:Chemotaxis protein n=1 Tax=Photobacterium aquae TaxID=1195763 RepID=A0A0J1HDA7_9GAMM|nr:methyl-accepting chemotaxis protein [Photobacterium aquae]KLV09620.1 hypothetical protein ABT56_00620 [Photobacterium aquae]
MQSQSHMLSSVITQYTERYFDILSTASINVDTADNSSIQSVMKQLSDIQNNSSISNVYIAMKNGGVITKNGFDINKNAAGKAWFDDVINGVTKRSFTEAYQDEFTKKWIITFSIPLYDAQNHIYAVAAADLRLDEFNSFVLSSVDSDQIDVYLTQSGSVIASGDSSMLHTNIYTDYPEYQNQSGRISYSGKQGEIIAYITNASHLGFSVANYEYLATIEKESNDNFTMGIGILCGASIIAMFLCQIFVRKYIYAPIGGEPNEINHLVKNISNGILTDIPPLRTEDIGVYRSTLIMANNIKEIISSINNCSTELYGSSKQIADSSTEADRSSHHQLAELEHVVTAINEMLATITEVSQHANLTSKSSNEAHLSATDGLNLVGEMNDSIQLLVNNLNDIQAAINIVQQETENVGGILDVIRGIADQTNLLALNAAIEAARAGEHGRGFAVVADEVRSLATKTQQSTDEIQTMILRLQEQVQHSVHLMENNTRGAQGTLSKSDEAAQTLTLIEQEIRQIQDMNIQIATATEEQSHVTQEINKNVYNINDISQEAAAAITQNRVQAEHLESLAIELGNSILKFKM